MTLPKSDVINLIRSIHFNKRIVGHKLSQDVVDTTTGEILAEAETLVTKELADTLQNSAVPYVWIQGEEREIKVLSSLMVDIRHYLPELENPKSLGVTELVYYPVLEKILEENDTFEDRCDAIKRDIHDLIPKHITKEDILASINYNMHLEYGLGNDDDIDHLATVVSVLSVSCFRISTASVFPDLSVWYVRE